MSLQKSNDKETTRTYPPKILVVEDIPTIQQIHIMLLKGLKCNIDSVKDGKEAVEKALKTHYDVILMDINMPNMDGIEATKAIRDAESSRAYIVGLTAYVADDLRESCIAAGMNILESKPISVERLQEICFRNSQST